MKLPRHPFIRIAVLLLLGIPDLSPACIWYDGTTLEGKYRSYSPLIRFEGAPPASATGPHSHDTARVLRDVMGKPEAVLKWGNSGSKPDKWPEGLNEAVALMFQKRPSESLKQLQLLNEKHPGNYYICANLGAACELTGNDTEALRWVDAALALNPLAHNGTEWMHSAVIRAKLELARDPGWLDRNTISGIPPGDVPQGFTLERAGRTHSLTEIHTALAAHSFTRVIFVKSPDKVTGALLLELARVEARLFAVERGLELLDLADLYGAPGVQLQRASWKALKLSRISSMVLGHPYLTGLLGFLSLILIGAVAAYVRSRRHARQLRELNPRLIDRIK